MSSRIGTRKMKTYKITLKVEFVHTYEKQEADEETGEGVAEPCGRPNCSCDQEEPLSFAEVDKFMCEPYCGRPRYHWYATSIMNATISDVSYMSGTLTFRVESDKSVEEIEEWIAERDYYQCFMEGFPGNEGLVPTRHRYGYMPMCTLALDYTHEQLGYMACRHSAKVEAQ